MSTICLVLCRLSGWLRLSPCWDMEGPKGCVALRTNAQEKSTAQFVAAGATDASSAGGRGTWFSALARFETVLDRSSLVGTEADDPKIGRVSRKCMLSHWIS